ncbi:MAG TPA: 2OG-Fe(II) oxygenase [Usitatibacter sp.]|nr:2OG-Fe(II) oxygenase [Usitatibacter sp.]
MKKSALRPLDREWLRWLQVNIERGCSREELVKTLLINGFDDASVVAALKQVLAGRAPAPVTAAPAEIRIPNARKHPSDEIELYTAEDFFSPSECAELVSLIRSSLRPSTITTHPDGEPDKAFRTSRTCDLVGGEPVVRALDARICEALGLDASCAEPTQGQNYEVGQTFKPHTDFFKGYELEKYAMGNLGQRTWTFMVYLNVPEGGGETRFVDVGLTVKPKVGMAVAWNNLLPSGEPNYKTHHEGAPVTAGIKTVITKWFRMPIRPGG